MQEPKLVNEQQAAKRYGLSVFWFQKKRSTGDGPPFIKVGSAVRYPVEETDDWFAKHLRANTSQDAVRGL